MPLKEITRELVVLVGLAVITAFTANAFSPKGIAFFGDWDTSRGVITAKPKGDVVFHELEIGDIFTAKALYDSGAIFIDARAEEDYRDGHIKGAVSLPSWQFEEHKHEFKDEFPTHMMIVTYCSGRECDDSHVLAQCLLDEGYTDVRVFIDGYPAWEEEEFPIEQ
jgi:rhodanese-related sulfurtransferase